MQAGDVLVTHEETNGWTAVKVLVVDTWPSGGVTLHCRLYRPTPEQPSPAALHTLEVLAQHVPLGRKTFHDGWDLLGRSPVQPDELTGFHEYLKRVDFRRYLTATGQDFETVIAQANDHFAAGGALNAEQRHREAIEEYTRAIDKFPLYYEAIDNRGFSYLNLGDFASALDDFEHSLQIWPDGETAYFASGECLLRLGKLDEAEAIFADGAARPGEYQNLHRKFLHLTREIRSEELPSTG